MMQQLIVGVGFAFAASVQPGPLQAFLLARVTALGWRRTLPACLAPLVSDGPIVAIVLLVLGHISATAQQALRLAGGGLLLYFAWRTLREWRAPSAIRPSSAPHTLLQATLVNLLNPNPYLSWGLVLGPAVVAAWRDRPAHAVALVAAFYATFVAMLALFIILAGSARALGARAQRLLLAVAGLVLAGLGVYLIAASLGKLLGS